MSARGREGRFPEGYSLPVDDEKLLAECRIDTFRAGGPGGQHQNRTESGVRLTHYPSGLTAIARTERSQHRNRARALASLRRRLVVLLTPAKERKSTGVPKGEKERRLEGKRLQARKKELRRPPPDDT